MKMLKVIEKRRSVREYKDKLLDEAEISIVDEYIESIPQVVQGVKVSLRKVELAEDFFKQMNGYAGYHGVMISAPHYVVVTATFGANCLKAGGYAGEWFVLNLTRHNIGTCWISPNHSEARIAQYLALPEDEEVVGVIGYGYAKGDMRIANVYNIGSKGQLLKKATNNPHITSEYTENPVSGRISIEDIVYMKAWGNNISIEMLEDLGYDEIFYYMRLAPSSVNRQPWRFIIDRGNFVLVICREDGYDDDRLALLEAGIAMLYFEVAMHDSGYPGKWNFEHVENKYNIPERYLLAGTYNFI